MSKFTLRDLIYLDFDKIASIASQIDGGLLQTIESQTEEQRSVGGGLKVPLASLGGDASDLRRKLETRIIHHDILEKVEEALLKNNVAIDVNEVDFSSYKNLISELKNVPYIISTGEIFFQDYSKLLKLLEEFNDVREVIITATLNNGDYKMRLSKIQNQEDLARRTLKSNAKRERLLQLSAEKERLENEVNDTIAKIPEWLIEGMPKIVELLMPNYLNLRMQPLDKLSRFQILANLKRDCLMDTNVDNLIYAYGTKTNTKLTLFGIITSIPMLDSENTVQVNDVEPEDIEVFENAFQGLFSAMNGLENWGRFSYYPRVTVYPLAVYRNIVAP